jgi:hypothetical protein
VTMGVRYKTYFSCRARTHNLQAKTACKICMRETAKLALHGESTHNETKRPLGINYL